MTTSWQALIERACSDDPDIRGGAVVAARKNVEHQLRRLGVEKKFRKENPGKQRPDFPDLINQTGKLVYNDDRRLKRANDVRNDFMHYDESPSRDEAEAAVRDFWRVWKLLSADSYDTESLPVVANMPNRIDAPQNAELPGGVTSVPNIPVTSAEAAHPLIEDPTTSNDGNSNPPITNSLATQLGDSDLINPRVTGSRSRSRPDIPLKRRIAIGCPIDRALVSKHDGNIVVLDYRGSVLFVDLRSGQITAQHNYAAVFHIHVTSVAISDNGRLLAIGTSEGTVILTDMSKPKQIGVLKTSEDRVENQGSVIYALNFNRDLANIRLWVLSSSSIQCWSVSRNWILPTWTWKRLSQRQIINGRHFDISPDERQILVGADKSELLVLAISKTFRLRMVDTTPLHGRQGGSDIAPTVRYSRNGKCAAVTDADGTIHVFDVATATTLARFSGHVGGVSCVAFSWSGDIVYSGGHDRTLRAWHIDRGSGEVIKEDLGGPVASIAGLSDQYLVVAAGSAILVYDTWSFARNWTG